MVHVTINDASSISTSTEYFVEHDTDPNFGHPHVEHFGASRGKFFNLPANDDNGNPQPWHFRIFAEPWFAAVFPVYFGGSSPTPVTLSGSTNMTRCNPLEAVRQ